MKSALLIAWREYRQYVLSRGFLLSLVLFPLSVVLVTVATSYAVRARPDQTFVVFDQTGVYVAAIDQELKSGADRAALAAFDAYVKAAVDEKAAATLPAPYAPGPQTRERAAAFAAKGVDGARAALTPYLKGGAKLYDFPRRDFRRIEVPAEVAGARDLTEAAALLRPYLLAKKSDAASRADGAKGITAAILIPRDFSSAPGAPEAQYWSRNLTNLALEGEIRHALDNALRRKAAAALGLSPAALEEITGAEAPIASFRPDKDDKDAKLSIKDRVETILPAILTYALFLIMLILGNLLLTNTIEERSNKIVEMLLSSVTADQLMLGKLLGICAVGLTMPAIFVLGGVAALAAAGQIAGGGVGAEIASGVFSALFERNLLWVYLFYFLCAYALFAMIFVAIGAMSNSLQDAQTFLGPAMTLVFLPMPFVAFIYEDPNGIIAQIMTWIPIYTPYAVMLRAAADPPPLQIAGATIVMLITIVVFGRFMGRIFRNSILQSAPPRMRDVWELARRAEA